MPREPDDADRAGDEFQRRLLAGARDDAMENEGKNWELLTTMRPEERETLLFLLREFGKDDLQVMRDSLENLRTLRRFGRFGLWLCGFLIAGASAAALVQTWFTSKGGK